MQPQAQQPQPLQFNYASIDNRRPLAASPGFWGAIGLGILIALVCIGLGVLAIQNDQATPAIFLFVASILGVVPVSLYKTRYLNDVMALFARDNNMQYLPQTLSNAVFSEQTSLVFSVATIFEGRLVAQDRAFSELGNCQFMLDDTSSVGDKIISYTSKNGNMRQYIWGFMRVKLPRQVPRVLLDTIAIKNFGFSELQLQIDKSQRLSLEGGLDNYFALYAPLDYAQDAYYIFRPSVLQFISSCQNPYCVELVGDDLYIYTPKKINFLDKMQIEQMATLAIGLKAAFYATTKNYKDSFQDVLTEQQLQSNGQVLQAKNPSSVL